MDEATSALDEIGQGRLMLLLRALLPDTTVISIGHRPGLEPFHDRRFGLVRGETGARLVEPDARMMTGEIYPANKDGGISARTHDPDQVPDRYRDRDRIRRTRRRAALCAARSCPLGLIRLGRRVPPPLHHCPFASILGG
jgi:hypothetical protein